MQIFQIRSFQLSSILIFIGLDVDATLNPIGWNHPADEKNKIFNETITIHTTH